MREAKLPEIDRAQRSRRWNAYRASEPTGTPRRASKRVEASVFLTQLLLASGVLFIVIIDFLVTKETSEPLYFAGITVIFGLTAVTAAVPWNSINLNWVALVPLLDIVALVMIRESRESLAAGLFFIFPVLWLASHFKLAGAIAGPAFTTILIWIAATVGGDLVPTEITRLFVISVVLIFVSTSSYLVSKRTKAQRILLSKQAAMLESALAHARREERTLDEVLNAVTFGVVGFNADGGATLVNKAYREWVAETSGAGTSLIPAMVYAEDQQTPLSDHERPYARLLRGETFDDVIVWTARPGETRRAIATTGRQLVDEAGNSEGSVLITRDITELISNQRIRDDLVSSVSHELRTPLTSLLGYLELVQDDPDLSDPTRRNLEVASKNADRLIAIVSDFLAAKSDGGELTLAIDECDVGEVIQQAVLSFKPLAVQRSIELRPQIKADPIIEADPFRVRQIVDNLLSNAIKYNADSGGVSLRVTEDGDYVEVRVVDTGRGMTPDEQGRLFERFYRAESVRNSTVHGTGLGLSISREMARLHKGDLFLESSGPHGTTMVLRLPRRQPTDDSLFEGMS